MPSLFFSQQLDTADSPLLRYLSFIDAASAAVDAFMEAILRQTCALLVSLAPHAGKSNQFRPLPLASRKYLIARRHNFKIVAQIYAAACLRGQDYYCYGAVDQEGRKSALHMGPVRDTRRTYLRE